jgi:hypothetical protein
MSVRNLLAGKMHLVATLPDHLRVHVIEASKGTAFNVQVIPMPCMLYVNAVCRLYVNEREGNISTGVFTTRKKLAK